MQWRITNQTQLGADCRRNQYRYSLVDQLATRRLKIQLQPAVLRWARERAKLGEEELARKLQVKSETVVDWERSGTISIAQADKLALKTYTPVGYLYLPSPPQLDLPIPDFRARGSEATTNPSPALLETIYSMQLRQSWMREYLIEGGNSRLDFVGSCSDSSHPTQIAEAMTRALGFDPNWAPRKSNWNSALRTFREGIDSARVLVIFTGIVGNNTHWTLDPGEFQGFALVDEIAPLVFVNSADFLAAQMFTLAHELAHVVIGQTGVSQMTRLEPSLHKIEELCNAAAAEFLVPEKSLRAFWPAVEYASDVFGEVSRRYKVSTLVAARRALDLGLITRGQFFQFYDKYSKIEWQKKRNAKRGQGNYWNVQKWRIGPAFGSAVVRAAHSGQLSHREACELTGLSAAGFDRLPAQFGVAI